MDQALKARLIGAVILVIVAVLVIPELLSGRKAEEATGKVAPGSRDSRTITIELGAPGSQTTASPTPSPRQQWSVPETSPELPMAAGTSDPIANDPVTNEPPVADASGTERAAGNSAPAVPGANKGASRPPVDTAAAAAPTSASSPAARAAGSNAPPRGASGKTWSVQVGAFGSSGSAQKLANELDGAGFPAYVATAKQGGKVLHRVRVGPVAERSEADRLASRLKSRRLPVSVVAND